MEKIIPGRCKLILIFQILFYHKNVVFIGIFDGNLQHMKTSLKMTS